MKKLSYLFTSVLLSGFMMVSFTSCKEDEPAKVPTVEIVQATVIDYSVSLTTKATDATAYAWDFGDGAGTSTEQDPTYTYVQSGTYTITVTATGAGGSAEATKEVSIAASAYEMLTGGASATTGKKWKLSNTDASVNYYANDPTFESVDAEFPAGLLGLIGLGSEYEDTNTFMNNGSYSQDFMNDAVVASALYAAINGLASQPSGESSLVLASYTEPSGATFTYNEEDLTMSIMPDQDDPTVVEDVTYTGMPYIEFTGDNAFMGILEWPRKYLVFELTNDKLVIGMFLHFPGNKQPGVEYGNFEPTHVLKTTFVPAE